jgi:hypothetical protein
VEADAEERCEQVTLRHEFKQVEISNNSKSEKVGDWGSRCGGWGGPGVWP